MSATPVANHLPPRDADPAEETTSLTIALAGLARVANDCDMLDDLAEPGQTTPGNIGVLQPEAKIRLRQALHACSSGNLLPQFYEYLKVHDDSDGPLVEVSRQFELTMLEALAVRIAVAAEEDLIVGHVLAQLQHPIANSRPTIGLLARAYGAGLTRAGDSSSAAIQLLAQGTAARFGVLEILDMAAPLPERQLRVPLPTCLALAGLHGPWPGTTNLHHRQPLSLGRAAESNADVFVQRLSDSPRPAPALILRSGDSAEGRAAAERIANGCGQRAILISTEQTTGLAPWLFLSSLMPVFTQWLAPGERRAVPSISGFASPIIILAGPDGEFTSDDRTILEWELDVPSTEERYDLWLASLHDEGLARRLASEHRHTAGRIAILAAKAHERAAAADRASSALNKPVTVTYQDVRAASRSGEGVGLAALAELVRDEVADPALVVPEALRRELESLVDRCRLRDGVSTGLGPAMQARYRPAVRALFVGPSGTGKTLAASWLATRLGLPLFRVDIAAITSKYIGETEKNLSQLLTRAEQSEVVLLFDEADSLFAKRTEVRDANDRFANSQTNYLLQRMESYDGITLLTSNSRTRFDSAFSRRLDVIMEFALPGPEERRALWLAHLGSQHALTTSQINIISASADLSGGQIRNVVLSAAVAARHAGPITYSHLIAGLTSEYRKLARQLPDELRHALGAGKA
jgi:hypothetical protein